VIFLRIFRISYCELESLSWYFVGLPCTPSSNISVRRASLTYHLYLQKKFAAPPIKYGCLVFVQRDPSTFARWGTSGRGKVVYERKCVHSSQREPYEIEITCPSATITGIACCPAEDDTIQLPVATVKSGGLSCKHVRIYLKPTEKGEWAYDLAISAELNLEPKASQQVRIE